jgi:hypothetical protein
VLVSAMASIIMIHKLPHVGGQNKCAGAIALPLGIALVPPGWRPRHFKGDSARLLRKLVRQLADAS